MNIFFKILAIIIESIYWLWTFISPFLLISLIGFFLWLTTRNIIFLYVFGLLGLVIGVYFAERIRKKVGSSKFMGKLLSTPEFEEQKKESK